MAVAGNAAVEPAARRLPPAESEVNGDWADRGRCFPAVAGGPQRYVSSAVATLEANKNTAGHRADFLWAEPGAELRRPGLPPNGDPRTPDIIVTPNDGVVYTGSSKKLEEHGGFAHDDTNVMLLLSNPAFRSRTVYAEVGTLQVAPTILQALGLDPRALDGVRWDGTGVLPDVNLNVGR